MNFARPLFLASVAVATAAVACAEDSFTTPGDAGLPDANVPTDAAPDVLADARPHTHCDDVDASLCEDFDRGPNVPGTPTLVNGLGSLGIDNQSFTSPPASLQTLLVPKSGDGGFAAAWDRFDVLASGSRHVTADFEWHVDLLAGSTPSTLDLFVLRADGVGGAAVHLQSAPDASASTLSFGPPFVPLRMPAPGTWEHVHLEISWPEDGGAPTATARIGADTPVTAVLASPPPQSTFNLLVGGIQIQGDTPKLFHHIDDVVMRAL